jgi:2-succinyl-6-hydroxy-2,4-cyclohexadiene-1-carboxylate synthase
VSDRALAETIVSQPLLQFLREWYGGPLFKDLDSRKDLLDRTLERRNRNDPRELAASLRGMSVGAQPSYWNHLAEISIPTLFIAGERDSRYAELAKKMAAGVSGARLEIMPDRGHAPQVECPHAYAGCLQTFLESLPTAAC